MKRIAILIGFCLLLVFLGIYAWKNSYVVRKTPLVPGETANSQAGHNEIHDGDLIFQVSKSQQSKAIQLATNSKYSHCGYDNCIWNGIMIRQGSWLAESSMHFASDRNKYQQKLKSYRRKSDRKNEQQIIKKHLD